MENFDVVITANSPGELMGQVRPFVCEVSKQLPEAKIILVLPPCQYSTGKEIEVAKQIKEIYDVILPQEYKNWIFKGNTPKGINFNKKGILVFMGGDLFHAAMIAKKLNYPAIAYARDHFTWKNAFNKFFVPDNSTYKKAIKKGVNENKLSVAGNLIVDSIILTMTAQQAKKEWHLDDKKPIVSIMLGSHPFQIKLVTSFFLKTAENIFSWLPDVQFIMPISKFTSLSTVEKYLNPTDQIYNEGRNSIASIVIEDDKHYIKTEKGLKILLLTDLNHDAINISDLVITMPGTNTAEIAAINTPMISVFPLNRPKVIPLEGLGEIIGNLPLIGGLFKIAAINALNKMIKYVALPNITAHEEIVPEIRGRLEPSTVSDEAVKMLKNSDRLDLIRSKLKNLMGSTGAAGIIVSEIRKIME